jgi:chromosome partitioning protein
MHTIAIANNKGGSAKTTTAVHLGYGLALTGRRVLIVDMDPQGHVSEALGAAHDGNRDIVCVLDRSATLAEIASPAVAGLPLWIAPATKRLGTFEPELYQQLNREQRLAQALRAADASYDYALVDCSPYFNLLTINALAAADAVLIPMVAEYLAMTGVGTLLTAVREIAAEINPTLAVLGVLPTRVGRTVNAREVVDAARREFGALVRVFDQGIPETVKFREAAGLGQPIFVHAPDHPGAAAYRELCEEVLRRA